ncbi:2'-5' RNA ligase family protein [Kineococcus sp. SYSU DK003]|uniref:2'-5' RNA ligase family protein n=1 Tax=Kineococcus sp. SYSU DK003 TaxID=3383124 RepID=UPI003D7E5053
MTYVVCAAFDPDLDARVLALQQALRDAGVHVAPPRHRPHLTLAGSARPLDELLDAVRQTPVAAQGVHLDEAGEFRRGAVLWAGTDDAALSDWHRNVLQDVPNEFPNAGPGQWRAHCTLARRVPQQLRTTALDVVRAALPLTGRIEALAVVQVGGSGDLALHRLPSPHR